MKKPIIVRENGKRLNQKYKKPYKNNSEFNAAHRDQAATLHESEDESIPIFARPSDTNNKQFKGNKSRFSYFKPIIVAIISAIGIGALLGVIMLRMFVGMDSDLSAQGSNVLPVVTNDEKDDKSETMTLSLESMEAHVLQAGVFSERENAVKWAKTYDESGLPSMIWKRENQYFLLLGLAGSQEKAKDVVEELKEQSFDIYVKEWKTGEAELELSQVEQEWFQSFREQWDDALTSLDNEEGLSSTDWKDIISNYPKKSDLAPSLFDKISNLEKENGMEAQVILLNLWNDYEDATR